MQLKGMLKKTAQARVRNKNKPIPLFSFGERIWVTGVITRVNPLAKLRKFENELTPEEKKQPNRVWEKDQFTDGPRQAIFLGFRQLVDGTAEFEGGEDGEGYYFMGSAYHKGALICIEGREPEKVFLDQCVKVPLLFGLPLVTSLDMGIEHPLKNLYLGTVNMCCDKCKDQVEGGIICKDTKCECHEIPKDAIPVTLETNTSANKEEVVDATGMGEKNIKDNE